MTTIVHPRRAQSPRRVTAGSLSPEFVLAAACCRPGGATRDLTVRAAAEPVDWARFGRVATRHRIEGLVHAALAAAGVTAEGAVGDALRRAAAETARAGLRMAAESSRLQGALDQAGVASLVLKGATLDVLAWGRIGLKRAWDIDLLVTQTDARRVRAVLEREGYDIEGPPSNPRDVASASGFDLWTGLAKEAVFRHHESGVVVELHWRLTDVATLLPDLSARSPAQTVRLSDSLSLRTLADGELFAYLCVHGASHAWSRLKWLADLGALLARQDDAGRVSLYRRAEALNAGNCPASALLLCDRLLDLPLPSAIAAEILANRKAARLAAVAIRAMTGDGGAEIAARPLAAERILLSHFLFADGWPFRMAELRRQWVSVDDRMRLRLPPSLAFLYGPLRAPLWIWRRLRRLFRRP